jgi:hypothetical protein
MMAQTVGISMSGSQSVLIYITIADSVFIRGAFS